MKQRDTVASALLALVAAAALLTACKSGSDHEKAEPAEAAAIFDAEDRLGLRDAPLQGKDDAVVTIVEFSSYQCPFCGRVQPTLEQLRKDFPNDVRFSFKQHPLPSQANSRPAARAALAAHAQGKFWEYSALQFANQGSLSEENFVAWAQQLGLDVDKFNTDRNADWTNARVDADLAVAGKFNVRGTPNFLINGKPLAGAQPYELFAAAVREEIAATRPLVEGGKSVGDALAARLDANKQAAAAAEAAAGPGEPDPNQKLKVPVGNSPVRGGAEPLVTLVEFSSYQCPFCNRVRPTIAELQEQYGDDLRVVFKHRPLAMHQQAEPAARAAIAAQSQGKFWDFHAGLFDNQARLGEELFLELAEKLGLDIERFKADMESEATKARVREDSSLADQLLAQGTPQFFINGYRIRGAQEIDFFKAVIDRELAVSRKLVDDGTARAEVYDRQQADAAPKAIAAAAPPPPPPAVFKLEGVPSLGPVDSRVTVVEFSDFQCGFCGQLAATLAAVMPEYEDRVRFVSMQFPIDRFPHSQKAAEAALAAHEQGKYWEYKKLVYENQRSLTDESFEQFAEQIGLDMDRFRADLGSGRYAAVVFSQREQGEAAGVGGTPALFLNGRHIGGAIPPQQLRVVLDGALG